MSDLIILEAVIAALLAVGLSRPFVRRFRGVDGLSALPALAFGLSAALVLAFGFRPEALPLTLFAFFSFVSSLPRLADIARRLRTDDYGERLPAVSAIGGTLLVACFAFAAVFAPASEAGSGSARALRFTVADPERGAELSFTLEGADGPAPRPSILFVPSSVGSAGATRRLRSSLVERGFAVLSFSRVGADLPAEDERGRVRFPGRAALADVLFSGLWGRRFAFAAEAGARLERGRLEDLRFALDLLRERAASGDPAFASVDAGKVLVVGCGAGASAALLYAADAPAAEVRAVVAVEPPLYSLLALEAPRAPVPAPAADASLGEKAARFMKELASRARVRRVLGPGRETPVAEALPVALLLSDRIGSLEERDGRYAGAVRLFRAARSAAYLVSFPGAGPLHYYDVPADYPVYAFFAPGLERAASDPGAYASRAADVCAAFAGGGIEGADLGPFARVEKNR